MVSKRSRTSSPRSHSSRWQIRSEIFGWPSSAARARDDAIQVGLDADEPLGDLGQPQAGGADAAPDFEHVRADVRPQQLEYVRLVPLRLAHRFEVVGGVLLLGLGEPVVDVHV